MSEAKHTRGPWRKAERMGYPDLSVFLSLDEYAR